MAHYINIPSFKDHRGSLHVLEKAIPFEIKRVYYIYGVPGHDRGGHRHVSTDQVLICLNGSCVISQNNGISKQDFVLDNPEKALFVHRDDWHIMKEFSENSILLVLASTHYDVDDYIDEPYPENT